MPSATNWQEALRNAPSPKGWSKRRAAADEAAAARADEMSEDKAKAAIRKLAWDESKLAGIVTQAEERVRDLQAKLQDDAARLERVTENTHLTGTVTDESMRLRLQVRTLPEVIARAEAARNAARNALAAHRVTMAPFLAPTPEPVQAEAPATTTAKKGRRS